MFSIATRYVANLFQFGNKMMKVYFINNNTCIYNIYNLIILNANSNFQNFKQKLNIRYIGNQ